MQTFTASLTYSLVIFMQKTFRLLCSNSSRPFKEKLCLVSRQLFQYLCSKNVLFLSRFVCLSVNRIRHENNAHHKTQKSLLKQVERRAALMVNYRQEEKKILDLILNKEVYDARMRPNGVNASDGPTIVNVNLYFRSFEKIDDVRMVSLGETKRKLC